MIKDLGWEYEKANALPVKASLRQKILDLYRELVLNEPENTFTAKSTTNSVIQIFRSIFHLIDLIIGLFSFVRNFHYKMIFMNYSSYGVESFIKKLSYIDVFNRTVLRAKRENSYKVISGFCSHFFLQNLKNACLGCCIAQLSITKVSFQA